MTAKELEQFRDYPGKIRELAASLRRNGIPSEISQEILEGGKEVNPRDKEEMTHWFQSAMSRMDWLLGDELCHAVREGCACCLTGKRHALARQIFRENDTLESRLEALGKTSYIVGHSACMEEDGNIWVRFSDQAENASCPCMKVEESPMPISYCYCCGGHIKHHLETALGVKTRCRTVSSLLSSGGKKPCIFAFTILTKK